MSAENLNLFLWNTLHTEEIKVEIKNLSQLKKALKQGVRFEIVNHIKAENIGEIRTVTKVQSNGIYSKVNNPLHNTYNANAGKGYWLEYRKASDWEFQNGLATFYNNYDDGKHEPIHELVITLKVLEGNKENG